MPIFAVIVALIFLYSYAVFSSVEFGLPVFNLWPKLLDGKKDLLKNYLSPLWETTNVFLVGFVVCIFTFFPGSIKYFGTDLMPLIFTGLVLAGARVVAVLLIYYGDIETKFTDWLLFLSSFLMPCVLSGFYLYSLTGRVYILPKNFMALSLWLVVCSSILVLSSTFFRYYAKAAGLALARLIKFSVAVFTASVLLFYLSLIFNQGRLFASQPLDAVILTFQLIVFIFLYVNISEKNYFRAFFGAVLSVGAVLISIVAIQLPYLVYPKATIFNSFTDPASFKIMMYCLPVGLIVVLPPIIWLYRSFAFRIDKNSSDSIQ